MIRPVALILLAAGLGPGCSAILDFEDTTNLPCPCLPDHLCVEASDRCVPKQSVDDFRSCELDVATPDELCKGASKCIDTNGRGPRCLPPCTATTYSVPEVAARLAGECPQGTACFTTPRGGFCDEGVCDVLANNCAIGEQCISFNGAGLCFLTCRIFTQSACAGAAICHPIGDSAVNACIVAGPRGHGDICDDINTCTQDSARPLVCDRPINSGDQRRCLPACSGPAECLLGESCTPSRRMPGDFSGICL